MGERDYPTARETMHRVRFGKLRAMCRLAFPHLLLLLTLLAPSMAGAANPQAQIKQSEQELAAIRARIQSVAKKLAADREEQDELHRDLRKTEQRIAALSGDLHQLDLKYQDREKEASARERDREAASQRLNEQRTALAAELRSSFIVGQQEKTKLLLNQEDPTRIGRLLAYFEFLSAARTRRITGIQQEVAALKDAEAALAKELTALIGIKTERSGALDELKKARSERNRRLDAVETRIADANATLRSLKQTEDKLEHLLQTLKRELTDIPAEFGSITRFSAARGKLPWPVKGRLLANFGQRKNGTSLRWNGIWIASNLGTPVRAVANGRVVYIGWMHRMGLLVVLQHEDGYYSLYAHNQSERVSNGQTVRAGQVLATVGNTGGHREAGLYFEIRKGRSPQNPNQWLRRR